MKRYRIQINPCKIPLLAEFEWNDDLLLVERIRLCAGGKKSQKKTGQDSKNKIVTSVARELENYISGKRKTPPGMKNLNLSTLSRFERTVLCELRRNVPRGRTVSYSRLANFAGNPNAARAVGNAMKKNPFPIVFPCHRVIKSDGSIGAYSGGKKLKELLLKMEEPIEKF
jgi:methylated-DNA-[protein]-cysteine S-methyltransferase